MSKKTILQCYKEYYPERGGVMTCMENIAEAISSSACSKVICTRKRLAQVHYKHNEQVIECKSLFTAFSMPISLSYLWRLYKLSRQADTIIHHAPFPLSDLILSWALPQDGELIIYWHSDVIGRIQRIFMFLLSPFIHACLRRANKIIVSNPELPKQSKYLQAYADKCRVIPFGVDRSAFVVKGAEEEEIAAIKRKYGKFYLAVGRLVPYKGYEFLIKATAQTTTKVIIIGEGRIKGRLKKLINSYQLEERVILLGKCPMQLLRYYLNACYALVLPSISHNETFAIAQIEAMCLQKPIINTWLGNGVNWVARADNEALTVPPKDAKALANALDKLWYNEELHQKLAANAFARYQGEFCYTDYINKLQKELLA